MNKKISIKTLNKIKMCLYRIFEAEDDDIPNNRIIKANERELNYYLKKYSKHEKDELLRFIRWTNDDCVSDLEKYGWEVTKGKEEE